MIKIIKGCDVYTPEHIGIKDILIIKDTIAAISDSINIPQNLPIDIEVIDGNGKIAIPGLIDSHVHIAGGGGEGSFSTRTPEIQLSSITTSGITTVVGCLGTDGVTRSMENLLAKARALDEEGITTYTYTGCYRVPTVTITGSVMKDIISIDKIIGVGEIAISDHRSSQPTIEELKKLSADSRVAGILSGKCGIINFHVGSGKGVLNFITDIVSTTEIPFTQFLPTHINRSNELLMHGLDYAISGGFIDFTTSSSNSADDTSIKASKSLKTAIDKGASIDHITFTSDGQGSLPEFDKKGNFLRLGIGKVHSLFDEFKDAVKVENIPLETALKPVTSNPAKLLMLKKKGSIAKEMDADVVLLNKNLDIDTVIARGKTMVSKGNPIVFGTFEK